MSATPLGSRLELLQSELERLLSFFEAERVPDPATIDAAWSAVTRSFERVQGTPGLAQPDEAIQERIDRCLRLYAVAAGIVGRRRDEIAAERATCAVTRRRLTRVKAAPTSGGSCDVRG